MEYFILKRSQHVIHWDKLSGDLLNIIHLERTRDDQEISANPDLSIAGRIRCALLADKIRPENITFNETTNAYSVTKRHFTDKNPLLCPWDHENCLYPLLLTVFYLDTKRWIHQPKLPPRMAKNKLEFLFSSNDNTDKDNNIRILCGVSDLAFECIREIVYKSDIYSTWKLL